MKIMQASPSSNDKFLWGREIVIMIFETGKLLWGGKNWKMMTETLISSFWGEALEDDENEDNAGLSKLKL